MTAIKKIINEKTLLSSLVIASLFGFLWIFAELTVKYFVYLKQGNSSIAEVFEWGVVELEEDKFIVCADFLFQTDGTEEYVSQHLFEKTPFLTKEEADKFIEHKKGEQWNCYWYGSANNPIVSLNRTFPTKTLCYSLISLAIVVYFSRLKKKVLST